MFLTQELWTRYLQLRNHHMFLYGEDTSLIDEFMKDAPVGQTEPLRYQVTHDVYLFSCQTMDTKQSHLIQTLQDILTAPNFYSECIQLKLIVILHCNYMKPQTQHKVKSLMDASYQSGVFCFHGSKQQSLEPMIQARCLTLQLPSRLDESSVDRLCYERLRKHLKQPLTKHSITELREMCYMYYLHDSHSESFQRMIVAELGKNLYLPNPIKLSILEDITKLNHLYQHSYRKPIFLEAMIYSLFKHLEHYTYNL